MVERNHETLKANYRNSYGHDPSSIGNYFALAGNAVSYTLFNEFCHGINQYFPDGFPFDILDTLLYDVAQFAYDILAQLAYNIFGQAGDTVGVQIDNAITDAKKALADATAQLNAQIKSANEYLANLDQRVKALEAKTGLPFGSLSVPVLKEIKILPSVLP